MVKSLNFLLFFILKKTHSLLSSVCGSADWWWQHVVGARVEIFCLHCSAYLMWGEKVKAEAGNGCATWEIIQLSDQRGHTRGLITSWSTAGQPARKPKAGVSKVLSGNIVYPTPLLLFQNTTRHKFTLWKFTDKQFLWITRTMIYMHMCWSKQCLEMFSNGSNSARDFLFWWTALEVLWGALTGKKCPSFLVRGCGRLCVGFAQGPFCVVFASWNKFLEWITLLVRLFWKCTGQTRRKCVNVQLEQSNHEESDNTRL